MLSEISNFCRRFHKIAKSGY